VQLPKRGLLSDRFRRRGRASEVEAPRAALQRVLGAGARLSGSTGGAAVGVLVGGPVGAFAGAGAGWAIQEIAIAGADVAQRWLSPRAEERVGAVLLLATDEISARIMAGERPRDDLRGSTTAARSPAAELIEATLVTASQTHEERKLPYLAHLLAAIAFEHGLSPADSNQLIGLAEALTYRQLVVLAVFDAIDGTSSNEIMRLYGPNDWVSDEPSALTSIRVDMLDLFQRGLVRLPRRIRREVSDMFTEETDLGWPGVPSEVGPRDLQLTSAGERLTRMMRLVEIPEGDRQELVRRHITLPTR
jgi:hypothetical protein